MKKEIQMPEYTDNPDLIFQDISTELWRKYQYPQGLEVKIQKPVAVCVSNKHRDFGGNGHRIVDDRGVSHYIPAGWIHLSWQAKEGAKPYNF